VDGIDLQKADPRHDEAVCDRAHEAVSSQMQAAQSSFAILDGPFAVIAARADRVSTGQQRAYAALRQNAS
jgi:hypothetical protein